MHDILVTISDLKLPHPFCCCLCNDLRKKYQICFVLRLVSIPDDMSVARGSLSDVFEASQTGGNHNVDTRNPRTTK